MVDPRGISQLIQSIKLATSLDPFPSHPPNICFIQHHLRIVETRIFGVGSPPDRDG